MIKKFSQIYINVEKKDLIETNVIYLLEINEKIYIGQTTRNLRSRLYNHCLNKSGCPKLSMAVQKYKNIKVTLLEKNLTINQLNIFEQFYIKLFNSIEYGYNITTGGHNFNHAEETKKKLSEYHKGLHHSEETKKKLSEINKGKTLSEETKKKISESCKGKNTGKIHSEETRKKISDALQKGTEHRKTILCKKILSLPDNIIFNSVNEASKYYNIHPTNLYQYYKGKIHKASGQTFKII